METVYNGSIKYPGSVAFRLIMAGWDEIED